MSIDILAWLIDLLISLALWAYAINEIAKERHPEETPPIEKYLNKIIKSGKKDL